MVPAVLRVRYRTCIQGLRQHGFIFFSLFYVMRNRLPSTRIMPPLSKKKKKHVLLLPQKFMKLRKLESLMIFTLIVKKRTQSLIRVLELQLLMKN